MQHLLFLKYVYHVLFHFFILRYSLLLILFSVNTPACTPPTIRSGASSGEGWWRLPLRRTTASPRLPDGCSGEIPLRFPVTLCFPPIFNPLL